MYIIFLINPPQKSNNLKRFIESILIRLGQIRVDSSLSRYVVLSIITSNMIILYYYTLAINTVMMATLVAAVIV